MKYLLFLLLCAMGLLTVVKQSGSERPKYREDYRYEKAFNAFYKVHPAANWYNARIRCQAENSHLMVPKTLDEADAMTLLTASTPSEYQGVYVGIHDLYSKRFFVTIEGSKLRDSILDLLWEKNEPKYNGGRCAGMRRDGRLFVNPCIDWLPFICKTKAAHVTYYPECDTYDPRWKPGFNGSCYISHPEPQTWHQAHGSCLAAGGYLAILNNRDEAEYIRELFKNIDQIKTPGDFAFLGFSDLFQLYHYRTVHGNMVNKALDWDPKCPQPEKEVSIDRCGGIRRSGLLATADCTIPSVFFCEKPAKGSYVFKSMRQGEPHLHHKRNNQEIIKVEEKNYFLFLLLLYFFGRTVRN